MNKLVCLVGMTGSGKTFVSEYLKKKGFSFVRFGQITLDIVKERGLEPSEENEKKIREDMRKKHGMGAYATINLPKFDKLLVKGHVVGDGLYSWSEYKILKERYGDSLIIVAVFSPPKLRYERLSKRKIESGDLNLKNRPATKEQAKNRDYAEIENIEKGGPIALADFTIINIGTTDELILKVDSLIEAIKVV